MGLSGDWEKAVKTSEQRLKNAIAARIEESENATDPKERELAKSKGKGNPFFTFPKFKGDLGDLLEKLEKAKKPEDVKKYTSEVEILVKTYGALIAKYKQYWKPWEDRIFTPLTDELKKIEKAV